MADGDEPDAEAATPVQPGPPRARPGPQPRFATGRGPWPGCPAPRRWRGRASGESISSASPVWARRTTVGRRLVAVSTDIRRRLKEGSRKSPGQAAVRMAEPLSRTPGGRRSCPVDKCGQGRVAWPSRRSRASCAAPVPLVLMGTSRKTPAGRTPQADGPPASVDCETEGGGGGVEGGDGRRRAGGPSPVRVSIPICTRVPPPRPQAAASRRSKVPVTWGRLRSRRGSHGRASRRRATIRRLAPLAATASSVSRAQPG